MNEIGFYLAKKVTEYLIQHKEICYCHKEYCGTGFYYDNNKIYYTHFQDGAPELYYRDRTNSLYGGIISEFNTFEEFENWLENQTDHSLSGYEVDSQFYINNQRVTKQRLQELFAYNVLNHKNLD